MLKVSDAVREIVAASDLLRFGLHHRLLNLSQVARYLQPLVEARTMKELKPSAIQMALSRLQAQVEAGAEETQAIQLEKINIQPGLCSLTVTKSPTSHKELRSVIRWIQERDGFLTVTEGMREITAILEAEHLERALSMLSEKPRGIRRDLASLGIQFDPTYLDVPGVLHRFLETVALQGINVVEVASTSTEFTLYLNEEDVQLAFESVYGRFAGSREE